MKTALIFGVTGQDGSYLAELLLSKGYRVVGVSRRVSVPTDQRIVHLRPDRNFVLAEGDVSDASCVARLLRKFDPANEQEPRGRYEIYNLAAQSHVHTSFDQPGLTSQVTYVGCLNILEAVRDTPGADSGGVRFYQASSSEMFGGSKTTRYRDFAAEQDGIRTDEEKLQAGRMWYCQDEHTPMTPNSPYAVAKLAAHHLVRVYRDSYGLHASSGILFNHESERRGEQFVTRKITRHVARWKHAYDLGKAGETPLLRLGNLDAQRDWGHAEDYVAAMHAMLQQDRPDDYVIATGETHSVREFLTAAFGAVGVYVGDNLSQWVQIDESLKRPSEVPMLRGDAAKARAKFGWAPKVGFADLARRMVVADLGAPK